MPQASNESRSLMQKWFGGDGISDYHPMKFLESRGWTFTHGGMIEPPVPSHTPSLYELECIYFLCAEWDYGYHRRYKL